jgi:uncharacterized protein YqgV (UPF0045/DUF77 family)
MDYKINAAIQFLPQAGPGEDTYAIIDKAIGQIQESGLYYKVCPFETIVEGTFDQVTRLIKKMQETCFDHGANEILIYTKFQVRKGEDVHVQEKMHKYQ